MYTCPQNHASEAADFCSVCGVEMAPSGAARAPAQEAAGNCPDCDTPREGARQVFCEVCGYNFQTRASGVPPVNGRQAPSTVTRIEPLAKARPTMPAAPRESRSAARWDVEVRVDGALYGKPNPDAPLAQPIQSFTLFEAENLIGRPSTQVRVHVPIAHDPGVSRRQALLLRRSDGSLWVRDLGSANGTQLNGKDIVAGVDTPLHDGDSIGVGAWTRIIIHAVAAATETTDAGEARS